MISNFCSLALNKWLTPALKNRSHNSKLDKDLCVSDFQSHGVLATLLPEIKNLKKHIQTECFSILNWFLLPSSRKPLTLLFCWSSRNLQGKSKTKLIPESVWVGPSKDHFALQQVASNTWFFKWQISIYRKDALSAVSSALLRGNPSVL